MSRDSALCCAVVVPPTVPTTITTAATVRCHVLMSTLLRAFNRGIREPSQGPPEGGPTDGPLMLLSARSPGGPMILRAFTTLLISALLALPLTAYAQEATLSRTIVDSTTSVLAV